MEELQNKFFLELVQLEESQLQTWQVIELSQASQKKYFNKKVKPWKFQ
jgi:hypothetical protein